MSAEVDVRANILEGETLILNPKQNVTQTTSITTAVTANGTQGMVTTVTPSIASGSTVYFTVNNNTMLYNTQVNITSIYPSTGTGKPLVQLAGSNANGFTISISNVDTVNPINSPISINFLTS